MKKYSVIFCFLLATVFVGVPSFFAFAGEQGTLGDSQVDYVFEESTGTLTLTGTGATPDYTPESLPPFAAHRSQIRRVQVEEGITGLGGQSVSSVDGCYGCAVARELENHWQ